MSKTDTAADQIVSPAKLEWVAPEITSFTAAVNAQGSGSGNPDGGGGVTNAS